MNSQSSRPAQKDWRTRFTSAIALHIRNKVLQAFEQAEEDPRRHQDLLTFVLVGARPTGVGTLSSAGSAPSLHVENRVPPDRSRHCPSCWLGNQQSLNLRWD
jgi:hypothetical protein